MIDPADSNIVLPEIKIDGKKPITGEIASAATDVDMFQGWLPVMENTDPVLIDEGGGNISLYDQIGRDSRVAANLRTRAKAVVGREWQITPFSQETIDIKIAEYVNQVFLGFPYDRCRRPVLRGGVLKGYAVGEVMWGASEGDVFIDDMRYRHQRRFRFAPNGDLHLLTIEDPYPGINVTRDAKTGLPLRKFQVFTFGDEVITRYGSGLGQELYWPWWFKKNGIKFWLTFVEKFAAPTVVGEYPAGSDDNKKNELLSAAQAMHSNAAVVHPAGMSLSLLEAARSGNISTYKELSDFMNDEMTICILGQLATTSGTPGKLGNSQEQEAVYLDYIKDDADSICEAQNDHAQGVVAWIVDYQFPGHGKYPKIWIKTEDEEDGKTLAERDQALATAMNFGGRYRLGKSYYIRNYGLEKDDIEEIAQPASPTKKPAGPAFAEGDGPRAPEDLLADRLDKEAQPAIDAWIERLKWLLDKADSLEQFKEIVLAAYGDLPTGPLADTLAQAMTAMQAAGRFDVQEQSGD